MRQKERKEETRTFIRTRNCRLPKIKVEIAKRGGVIEVIRDGCESDAIHILLIFAFGPSSFGHWG